MVALPEEINRATIREVRGRARGDEHSREPADLETAKRVHRERRYDQQTGHGRGDVPVAVEHPLPGVSAYVQRVRARTSEDGEEKKRPGRHSCPRNSEVACDQD